MSFDDDDRGVVVQIGFILIFGIIMTSFSLYHAQVAPGLFSEEEFEHNQEAVASLAQLSDSMRTTARSGVSSSSSVDFGNTYQTYAAYDPVPMFAVLETTNESTVVVENISLVDNPESNEYWNGPKTFTTRTIRFQPGYTYYEEAPTTYIEYGILHNKFRNGANLPVSDDQSLVVGRTVNLIMISGDYRRTETQSQSINIYPVSTSEEYLLVESDMSISFPTYANRSVWNNTEDASFVDLSYTEGDPARVELNFTPEDPIRLRLTKVSFSRFDSTSPRYLSSTDTTVTNEGLVTVYDKFGNPVPGAEVTINETGETFISRTDGTVRFQISQNVTASIGNAPEEQVVFNITDPTGTPGPPPNQQGPDITIESLQDNTQRIGQGQNADVRYRVEFSAQGNSITSAEVELQQNSMVVDSDSESYGGVSSTGVRNFNLQEQNGDWQGQYTIVVRVTDNDGTTEITRTDTADGTDP